MTVAKADKDLETFIARLKGVHELDGVYFKELMISYVEHAKKNDEVAAKKALERALQFLDTRKMFQISDKEYRSMASKGAASVGSVDKAAALASQRTMLWSKIEMYQSINDVHEHGGVSLEASVAGKLFDQLTFGMSYSVSAVLQEQWTRVSQTYVAHASGDVHAQVFRGIDPNSVFTKTEWKVIEGLMKKKVVGRLVIHVFDLVSGTLTEKEQWVVTSSSDWEKLPRVTQKVDQLVDGQMQQVDVHPQEYTAAQQQVRELERNKNQEHEKREDRINNPKPDEKGNDEDRKERFRRALARFLPYEPRTNAP